MKRTGFLGFRLSALVMSLLFMTGVWSEPASLSVEQLKTAAEQGDPQLQYDLGMRYLNGDNVARNNAEAARWFRLAAERKFAPVRTN